MKLSTAVILVALAAAPAYAQQSKESHDSHHPAAAVSDGEVRKVDKHAKKITIRHGPLQHLDMPAMTMVFHVVDPGLLDKVKAGDKVKFQAEKRGEAFTITKIEPAQ